MMVYAQFFGPSALDSNKIVPMCGLDGIFLLVGVCDKFSPSKSHCVNLTKEKAEVVNRILGKGIKAFQLMRGRKFTDAKPITEIMPI